MPVHPRSRRFLSVLCLSGLVAVSVGGNALAASGGPVITSLSTGSGPVVGHNKLTVHGHGFTGVTAVLFGGAKGGSLHVLSSSTLTVVVPAHPAKKLDVRVVTSQGTSPVSKHDVFTYVAPPAVKSVSAAFGAQAGGLKVVLKGSGFTHVKKVLFGKVAGSKVHVASGSSLSVVAPAHVAGRVDIRVVSSYGTSPAKPGDRFTFLAPPVITTTTLPAAERGQPYSGLVALASGTPPLTVTATGLPPGIALSASGVLSGATFAPAQTYAVTVTVTDAVASQATAALSLVVKQHGGQVLAWGSNKNGGLGNGTAVDAITTTPVPVRGLTNVVQVAGGYDSYYALRADGTVYSWGANSHGSLGNGSTADNFTPQQVPGVNSIVAVTASLQTAYALRSDGTVWAWGEDAQGELGDGGTAKATSAVQITALSHIVQVAAGVDAAYALTAGGQVWSWGDNTDGELGSGATTSAPTLIPGLANVREIAAFEFTAFALLADGTVRGWGDNSDGEVGDTTKTQRNTPVPVYQLTGVTAITASSETAYALKADGTLQAWGHNEDGEVGDGTTTDRLSPVAIPGATNVLSVTANDKNVFADRVDGSVLVWGRGSTGADADGTLNNQTSPEVSTALAGVTGIATAYLTELAIR